MRENTDQKNSKTDISNSIWFPSLPSNFLSNFSNVWKAFVVIDFCIHVCFQNDFKGYSQGYSQSHSRIYKKMLHPLLLGILYCLWFCRLRKLIRQRNFSHVRYWSPICWSYTEGVISNNIIRALGRKLKLLTFSQNREIRLVFTEGRHHGWRKENFLYNQQKAGKRHPGK